MTRLDISLGSPDGRRSRASRWATTDGQTKASGGPTPRPLPFGHDSTRLAVDAVAAAAPSRGRLSHPLVTGIFAVLFTSTAAAQPAVPRSSPQSALPYV